LKEKSIVHLQKLPFLNANTPSSPTCVLDVYVFFEVDFSSFD
jgi:hypothetical protein